MLIIPTELFWGFENVERKKRFRLCNQAKTFAFHSTSIREKIRDYGTFVTGITLVNYMMEISGTYYPIKQSALLNAKARL